jgi:hypothetical protein
MLFMVGYFLLLPIWQGLLFEWFGGQESEADIQGSGYGNQDGQEAFLISEQLVTDEVADYASDQCDGVDPNRF